MGSRESNCDRLLDNAEAYLMQAEELARRAWAMAKQNLQDWRDDMCKTDSYYLDRETTKEGE